MFILNLGVIKKDISIVMNNYQISLLILKYKKFILMDAMILLESVKLEEMIL